MTEKLALDHPADGVARLTISNPERRGALDHEILDALAAHARTLDARCLVIRGAGPLGWPGSAEVVNMQPPDALTRRGITHLPGTDFPAERP